MKTSKTIGTLITVISLMLSSARLVGAAVIFQDNFEANALGTQPPAGWSWASGGAAFGDANGVVTAPPAVVPANGAKVMNYFDNSGTGFGYVYKNITAPSLDSYVSFSFDFNSQTTSTESSFVGLNDFLSNGFWLIIDPLTSQVQINGNASVLSFTTGDWYHVNATLTPVTGSQQATVVITDLSGGPNPGSLSGSYQNTVYGFSQILLSQYAGSETGLNLFLDNFDVQTLVPEPSVGALLGLGGWLLWRRRRK